MPRGIGIMNATESLPEILIVIAGFVTQLGDMWFVLLAILSVYIVGSQKPSLTTTPWSDSLYLFALAIGAYALTVIFKHIFLLPRPPGAATAHRPTWLPLFTNSMYDALVTADGYGFPSGHALKSTVVYGGAAFLLGGESHRQYLVAVMVVIFVAGSRIILGVHYFIDVIVGILIGFVFLGGMIRITKINPERALVAAALLGLIAVIMNTDYNSGLVVIAAITGLCSWRICRKDFDWYWKRRS